jgi:hypothetical protein
MPKSRQRKTLLQQQEEIKEILKTCFTQKGNGFFSEVNGQLKLSHIQKGYCIKRDCNYRDSKTPAVKILLPAHLRKTFATLEDGTCLLPEDKIGQVVICLNHFLLIFQKHYLKTGKLPKGARLIGGKETKTVYEEGDDIPPAAPPNKNSDGGKVFYGHRISMTLGLVNTDWAKAKTLEGPSVDAAAAAANSPDVTPQSLTLVVDSPDSPNVSSRSLSPVDSPDVTPQSPAPSSSRRGEKRRDRSSSPLPNSSRDAAAKKRRVLDLGDENVEEESREDNTLLKKYKSVKQKLNEEKMKNDLSVKYEMLKKAFEELQRQKEETDQKLQQSVKTNKKDAKKISELSICAYKCLGHKEDYKKGSYYPQLGYGSSEEDLKNKIVKRVKSSKIDRQQILFQEIQHVEEKDIIFPCKPDAEEIVFDTSNYKLVVIYKKKPFCSVPYPPVHRCLLHCFRYFRIKSSNRAQRLFC